MANSTSSITLVPDGMLTFETAARFKRGVLDAIEAGARDVVLDLSKCEYIDSVGLGALVSLSKRIRATGGTLTLTGLNDDLKTLVALTNLDMLFTIRDEVAP